MTLTKAQEIRLGSLTVLSKTFGVVDGILGYGVAYRTQHGLLLRLCIRIDVQGTPAIFTQNRAARTARVHLFKNLDWETIVDEPFCETVVSKVKPEYLNEQNICPFEDDEVTLIIKALDIVEAQPQEKK